MTKSEAQTRSELIDQHLVQSGWNVKDPTQVDEEFDILTVLPEGVAEPRTPYEGHQFSDYVLLGKRPQTTGGDRSQEVQPGSQRPARAPRGAAAEVPAVRGR